MSERVAVSLRWLKHGQDLEPPRYHSELAAGMDVRAAVLEPLIVHPGSISLLPTGFAVALPPGYEFQVRPRSGLALKHGITLINSPGTIDADYRGEVKIPLINLGKEDFSVKRGDRIAQLILAPVCRAVIHETDQLPVTVRQDGGFGHTGL